MLNISPTCGARRIVPTFAATLFALGMIASHASMLPAEEIQTEAGPIPAYLPFPTPYATPVAAIEGDLPAIVPAQEASTSAILTAPPMPPAPKSGGLRPLGEVVIETRLPDGGALPTDMSAQVHAALPVGPGPIVPNAWADQRPWMSYEFAWVASNMVHRPLYFEDLNLERYGNSACPTLQPAISAARFAAELSVLPYQVAIHRPRECIYLLGYCRPGSPAPNLAYVPPLRLDAAALEAAAITGAVFIVP